MPVLEEVLLKLIASSGTDWSSLFSEVIKKYLFTYYKRRRIDSDNSIKLTDMAMRLWIYEFKSYEEELNDEIFVQSFKDCRRLTLHMWDSSAFREYVTKKETPTLEQLPIQFYLPHKTGRLALPDVRDELFKDESQILVSNFNELAKQLIVRIGVNLQQSFQTLVRIDTKLQGAL